MSEELKWIGVNGFIATSKGLLMCICEWTKKGNHLTVRGEGTKSEEGGETEGGGGGA